MAPNAFAGGPLAPLEHALHSGDESKLVEGLRKVKNETSSLEERARLVTRILQETDSSRVRNAAAIALTDMRTPGTADVLIHLLTDPRTQQSLGTLLYALEEIGGEVP